MEKILEINGLSATFDSPTGRQTLVDSVSFFTGKGEVLGITGESGSGKSMTCLCMMGLAGFFPGITATGSVRLNGRELNGVDQFEWERIRGKSMSVVFQQPDTALNPLLRCGEQIRETLIVHRKELNKSEARKLVYDLLMRVGLSETDRFYKSYPFQLSGGQLQRVALAIALANNPAIIIADEVTSSLDPVTADQIVQLLLSARSEGSTIVLISHDISMMKKVCDRILIMHQGRITDEFRPGQAAEGLSEYARKLLSPIDYKPRQPLSSGEVLLSVSGLGKKYKSGNFRLFGEEKKIIALEGVSFELKKGEMLGILGPSGSGKSTLARIITGLEEATSGKVVCQNKVLKVRAFEQDKHLRRQIQYVFQDPFSVFDPLQSFGDALIEVLKAHKIGEHAARINRVLNLMSLPEDILKRYVHQVSGGQRQRLALARVLLLEPGLLVFDESLSALDLTNRTSIVSKIIEIQQNTGFSGLFISHDIDLIRALCHNVLVLDSGKVIKYGRVEDLIPGQDA